MPEGQDLWVHAEPELSGSVQTGQASDVGRLRVVLADAFDQDPVWHWLIEDGRHRPRALRRYYSIELRHVGLRRGYVYTTADLTGAAIITPPHAWRVPPRAMLLQAFCGLSLRRSAALLTAIERRHLQPPHYYFAHIGVTPEAQGKGIGTALMRPTLDRCDREGLPAYLEASTDRSAALYERLGFELIDELLVGGSPPLRLMVRPPVAG